MLDKAHEAVDSLQNIALGLANPVLFALRQAMGFKRGGYREAPGGDETLSEREQELLADPRARELTERYDLESLRPNLKKRTWLTQLFYLDLLDRLDGRFGFATKLQGKTDVLEVGAKNFESAPALHRFFGRAFTGERDSGGESETKSELYTQRNIRLTGVELDAFRIYRGWHSRADFANYYLGLLKKEGEGSSPDGKKGETETHRYIAGDVMDHSDRCDVIAWFHPFLDAYPLLRWGLPRRYLEPEALFDHVMGRLRPGGVMIILNQEEHEKEQQIAMFEARGLRYESLDINYVFTRTKSRGYAHVVYGGGGST